MHVNTRCKQAQKYYEKRSTALTDPAMLLSASTSIYPSIPQTISAYLLRILFTCHVNLASKDQLEKTGQAVFLCVCGHTVQYASSSLFHLAL